jgi:hypothetical protein
VKRSLTGKPLEGAYSAMDKSPESFHKGSSDSIMLAEHKRISSLYIHNASMAERRVNIHLVLLGAGIGLLGLPKFLARQGSPGTATPTALLPSPDETSLLISALVIITFLLVEGALTFQRVIDRRIKALEYLRAINRVNCYFAERVPEIERYLFWLPRDDNPSFQDRAHGVADLRDLVAILSSLYFGALLTDISMLVIAGGHYSPRWSVALISLCVGISAAIAAWLLHLWYERRTLKKAEQNALANVRFPSPGLERAPDVAA